MNTRLTLILVATLCASLCNADISLYGYSHNIVYVILSVSFGALAGYWLFEAVKR